MLPVTSTLVEFIERRSMMKIPEILQPLAEMAAIHARFERGQDLAYNAARMASEGDGLVFGGRTSGATYAALVAAMGEIDWPEIEVERACSHYSYPLLYLGVKPIYRWLLKVEGCLDPTAGELEDGIRGHFGDQQVNPVRLADELIGALRSAGAMRPARRSIASPGCDRMYGRNERFEPDGGWIDYMNQSFDRGGSLDGKEDQS
jgi:hypothetical protein